jgi:putative oxidoreductase
MNAESADRIQRLLRLLLGVLMLWAAVSKLANPTDFLGSIYAYQLPLPRPLMQITAVVLPWVELLCGLLLVAGLWLESALVAVTGLMVVFVLATGLAWMRGLEIGCGCYDLKIFGLGDRLPGLLRFLESVAFAFFRNLGLTALAAYLLRRQLCRNANVGERASAN